MIKIYSDGSCVGNPGPGGWAAIILDGPFQRELHGREDDTTNNRMEMTAVIKGLEATPVGAKVKIFSDSRYVINTMTLNWKRRANHDLWSILEVEVANRDVEWEWVRGHSGQEFNERADALASQEAGANPGRVTEGGLAHVDSSGSARMVNVGDKLPSQRVAVAVGLVVMKAQTLNLVRNNEIGKGNVLNTARLSGIMGAKNTAQLIPLCHPIGLDHVSLEFDLKEDVSSIEIKASVQTTSKTGVEMEALTAVALAALTIYDMCKSVDRGIHMEGIRLLKKSGGRSGDINLEK